MNSLFVIIPALLSDKLKEELESLFLKLQRSSDQHTQQTLLILCAVLVLCALLERRFSLSFEQKILSGCQLHYNPT